MNEQAKKIENEATVPSANSIIAATPKKELTVQETLERMKSQFAMVLPKHITPERMVRIALTACQNNPQLLKAERKSFLAAIMRAAQLGLEPDGVLGQAYLIPFNRRMKTEDGWVSRLEVQFIPGYKGLIDLARRSGEVTNIIAKEVCKNDTFKIAWHQQPPFAHEQPTSGDRGEIIGFWAMANFKDGGYHWDYMSKGEVEAIRNSSAGWQAAVKFEKTAESPWEKHFTEMGKKTLIRRIAKYLPMSVQKAAILDELADRGVQFHENEFGDLVVDDGEVIDQETGEITDGKNNSEPPTKTVKVRESLKKSPDRAAEKEGETPPPAAAEESEIKETAPPALGSIEEVKAAGDALVVALRAAPPAVRTELFVKLHGSMIADALKESGQGLIIGKIREMGIKLPF